MRYLKEIELPEYCFLSELVEWVALGRIPESEPVIVSGVDNFQDSRFAVNGMPDNFNIPPFLFWGFSHQECASQGIERTQEYEDALNDIEDRGSAEHLNNMKEKFSDNPNIIADLDAELAIVEPASRIIEEFERQFDHIYEQAWSLVFNAIKVGSIEVEGMSLEAFNAAGEEWDATHPGAWHPAMFIHKAPFVQVDPKLLSLYMDWRINISNAPMRDRHFNLRVKTSTAIGLLSPVIESQDVSGSKYGDHFIADLDTVEGVAAVRGRGRKPIFNWALARSFFLSEHIKGTLPKAKDDAAYHVMTFIEKNGGKAGLTTIKDNLKDEFELVFNLEAKAVPAKAVADNEKDNGK